MAMLGSGMVGLRLLLAPISPNVVLRTACCTVGIGLPVYSTFKAIQSRQQEEQQKWLIYWAAYGSFSIVESLTDKIVYWFPFYYHMKFAFLVWLQFPNAYGARHLYMKYLRPFLVKHQTRLDIILGLVQTESIRCAIAYKEELEYVKELFSKLLGLAKDNVHPVQPVRGAIGAPPAEQVEVSESEEEE